MHFSYFCIPVCYIRLDIYATHLESIILVALGCSAGFIYLFLLCILCNALHLHLVLFFSCLQCQRVVSTGVKKIKEIKIRRWETNMRIVEKFLWGVFLWGCAMVGNRLVLCLGWQANALYWRPTEFADAHTPHVSRHVYIYITIRR